MKASKGSHTAGNADVPQEEPPAAALRKRFLRLPEVKTMTALSKASIYKRMAAHQFPQSIKLGSRVTVWLEDELIAWMNVRTAEARNG